MAMTQRPPLNITSQGTVSSLFTHLGNDVYIIHAAAAPADGTSGDGAAWAGPGSIYIDRTAGTGKAYINTNTKASPTWTVVGSQS
jgi:L-aminopeptidase/D-esterase-like protein